MKKRIWSIAVALAMVLSMICSVFVVSAADGILESGAPDASIQLNNNAPLLNAAGDLPTLALTTSSANVEAGQTFTATLSLENYAGGWAVFSADVAYDASKLKYESGEVASLTDVWVEIEASSGKLTVMVLSETGENIPESLATDGKLPLATFTFKVLEDLEEATNINVSFAKDEDGNTTVAGYNNSGDAAFITESTFNTEAVVTPVEGPKEPEPGPGEDPDNPDNPDNPENPDLPETTTLT